MWHFLPATMPPSLHAISYASPLRWWILMIPIHFQCTGSKFIGEEIWDLSCNRTCDCHMSSRYKDGLKWKRKHTQKTTIESLGKGTSKPEEIQLFYSFLSLSSSLLLLLNSIFFFSYLLEKHQHSVSSSHYNHHDMVYLPYANAFDNKNYTGWHSPLSHLSVNYFIYQHLSEIEK